MKIHAASRPHNDTTADPHYWAVGGDDYDQLLTEIRAAVPDGWDLLSVQVER